MYVVRQLLCYLLNPSESNCFIILLGAAVGKANRGEYGGAQGLILLMLNNGQERQPGSVCLSSTKFVSDHLYNNKQLNNNSTLKVT